MNPRVFRILRDRRDHWGTGTGTDFDDPNDCPSPSETFDYDLDGNLIDVYLPGDVDRDGIADEVDLGASALDQPTLTARCDPR
jgi:hypothetical protein